VYKHSNLPKGMCQFETNVCAYIYMCVFIQTYVNYADGQEMDVGPGRAVGMLHTPVTLCALPWQKHSTF